MTRELFRGKRSNLVYKIKRQRCTSTPFVQTVTKVAYVLELTLPELRAQMLHAQSWKQQYLADVGASFH